MRRGRLITLEGIDGAGKTTIAALLAERLAARGVEVVQTHEPGGFPEGEALRALILERDWPPEAEALLFFADRAAHVRTLIAPALARGAWVICDRYTDSTLAYQSARGLAMERLRSAAELAECGVRPDATFWLDLPVEAALARIGARAPASRFEREALLERVRQAYAELHRRAPERIARVDATLSPDRIADAIFERLRRWL